MPVAVHTISFRGVSGAIFIFFSLAFVLYVIGFATTGWQIIDGNKSSYSRGLWQECTSSQTTPETGLLCLNGIDDDCNNEADYDTQDWSNIIPTTCTSATCNNKGDAGCSVGVLNAYSVYPCSTTSAIVVCESTQPGWFNSVAAEITEDGNVKTPCNLLGWGAQPGYYGKVASVR